MTAINCKQLRQDRLNAAYIHDVNLAVATIEHANGWTQEFIVVSALVYTQRAQHVVRELREIGIAVVVDGFEQTGQEHRQ